VNSSGPAGERRWLNKHLDVPVHGGGLCGPDQALQLGAAVVLRLRRQLLDVHVGGQQLVLAHLRRVDVEDLDAASFIR